MKLIDRTPKGLQCDTNCCPAVFESDRGTFVIIGKKLSDADMQQLQAKVGADEWVIEIQKEYFAHFMQGDEVVL